MLHTTENVIRHKIGLLNLAEELDNVSKACKIMGVSRDTFYRYKEAVEDGGVEALIEQSCVFRQCQSSVPVQAGPRFRTMSVQCDAVVGHYS